MIQYSPRKNVMEAVSKRLAKLVCPRQGHVSLKELGWVRALGYGHLLNCKVKYAMSYKDSRKQEHD